MRNKPTKHVFLIFFYWVLFIDDIVMAKNIEVPVDVGVILDFHKDVAWSCIQMSLADFYETHSHYRTRLRLNVRHSHKDVVAAAAAALDLVKNVQVKAIIGPATSMQANFVIDLGEKAQIPIISYSATSPSLASIGSPYFFRATQSDSAQATAIGAIVESFGWKEAVPVYVDNEYGVGIIPYLTDALRAVDTRVSYRSPISPSSTDDQIMEELCKLKNKQTRVFIVHMYPSLGSRLFTLAKRIGMMSEGYVWIITDLITHFLDSLDYSVIDSMQGVLGVKPYIPRTKRIKNFQVQWKKKFHHDNPYMVDAKLNVYGLRAYDAAAALAMAIEKVAESSPHFAFHKPNVSGNVSTDLETFGVSQIGPHLHQALSNTSFKGLTGNFSFINGQLQPSGFEIVNLNGEEERRIGFWAAETGLVKRFNKSTMNISNNSSAFSNTSLSPVIWPGDTVSVPRGWEIPSNGKKLRILVPVKQGFTQFVNVTRDPATNASIVKGYCIDLFDAVVSELPYALPHEYIPSANTGGSYNDLIDQVYLKKYDAAVGDISIVANRSLYVDFTLPYMESGRVMMIVPITEDDSKKAWVFLKPLTWDLWLASFCFFLLIGFVVWVLEHRINEDFQGSPSQQVGTSFWFSFSTIFFAHREKVMSNLARVVVIIWCFVGLVLTQSYTASLSSFLTIQQLQPTFTSIDELIKKGENIGYQKGSFILGTLKSLGFEESKLVPYKSAEECDYLLSKGSRNGGIAAAFEGPTSIHLILGQNCSKYTLVEPISISETPRWKNISNIQELNTNGLGFVFPKGSPLAPDISRAILNVTQGDKIKELNQKWFGIKANCPDRSNSVHSNRLSLHSFWGLFLIAGIASFFAIIINFGMFVYKHRGVLMPSDSGVSMGSRILHLLKIFKQKDCKSHTSSDNVMNDEHSVSNYSIQTEFSGEKGTISAESVDPFPNGPTFQEETLLIELTDSNQRRTVTTEITNED